MENFSFCDVCLVINNVDVATHSAQNPAHTLREVPEPDESGCNRCRECVDSEPCGQWIRRDFAIDRGLKARPITSGRPSSVPGTFAPIR